MTLKTAVTFEFTNEPPETVRGEYTASNMATIAARAIRDARKQIPRRKPSSVVILLEQSDV